MREPSVGAEADGLPATRDIVDEWQRDRGREMVVGDGEGIKQGALGAPFPQSEAFLEGRLSVIGAYAITQNA